MSKNLREEDMARLRAAVHTLNEFYDSVQIFTTRHDPEESGGTVSVSYGEGNWYARVGYIRDWLVTQDERTREDAREK